MHEEERGTKVPVPHLAESLVSATVGKWLKQPGDYVLEYEALCELITDKVTVEMPAPFEGTLVRILVGEGETANVGDPICLIRETEEQTPPEADVIKSDRDDAVPDQRQRFSPAVRHLAQKHRIDLKRIQGTAPGGRITRKDVLAYIANAEGKEAGNPIPTAEQPAAPSERKEASPAANPSSAPVEASASTPVQRPAADEQREEHFAISHMRGLIAARMRQSLAEIPHAWLTIEADVSRLVALRDKLKERFESKEGVRLTYAPFVMKAIVNAIKEYPMLNAVWSADHIAVKKDIHLCVAIGSLESVVTPVIRHADRKTIAGLAIELDDLIKRTRSGKLTPADLQGGTFTFNNTGSFGSVLSYPIINYPQAAIVTFEAIVRKPVVVGRDMITIRSMVHMCMSFDHRLLDGMICGRFLQQVKHELERYEEDTSIY